MSTLKHGQIEAYGKTLLTTFKLCKNSGFKATIKPVQKPNGKIGYDVFLVSDEKDNELFFSFLSLDELGNIL